MCQGEATPPLRNGHGSLAKSVEFFQGPAFRGCATHRKVRTAPVALLESLAPMMESPGHRPTMRHIASPAHRTTLTPSAGTQTPAKRSCWQPAPRWRTGLATSGERSEAVVDSAFLCHRGGPNYFSQRSIQLKRPAIFCKMALSYPANLRTDIHDEVDPGKVCCFGLTLANDVADVRRIRVRTSVPSGFVWVSALPGSTGERPDPCS